MINTLIEWATDTLNFWWGCTKVSAACKNCYAERLARVWSKGRATWGPHGGRWTRFDAAAAELGKIVRIAARTGARPRIFVNSTSDTFESNSLIDATRVLALALLEATPAADFLLLTKRPENIRAMVPPAWLENWPAHIWVGTTVETQDMADVRIPTLLQVPASVRFLSCEPLLGPVEFKPEWLNGQQCIHWVIAGGESGGDSRPMWLAWPRRLRDQCVEHRVAFFFKQWGDWVPGGQSFGFGKHRKQVFTNGDASWRLGTKLAGRRLDNRKWDEIPEGSKPL